MTPFSTVTLRFIYTFTQRRSHLNTIFTYFYLLKGVGEKKKLLPLDREKPQDPIFFLPKKSQHGSKHICLGIESLYRLFLKYCGLFIYFEKDF